MKTSSFGLVSLAASAALLVACSSDSDGVVSCGVPNATTVCDCVGAPGAGVQSCGVDGVWSACDCSGASDVGSDVSDTSDAGTDTSTDAETDATTDTETDATVDTGADTDTTADSGCADDDDDGVCNEADICPGSDDGVDTDEDGVPDGCDACEGSDDAVDTDLDTVPDGCDICPVGADHIDTDEDGVPDGCDACEGFDDSLDEDEDGIPDDCDCNQTAYGHEICDGVDNDCDELVDELCTPIHIDDLSSFACMTVVNGHFVAPDADGGAFVGEFPGSNSAQGSLHHVADDGTVTLDVNEAMPYGFRDIEMSFDGRLWASGTGGAEFPNWDHIVMEVDPDDGSTIETTYEEPMDRDFDWFYASGVTVSSDGEIYFGNESSSNPFIVHVVDDAIESWRTGFGNNTDLALTIDEDEAWIGAGTRFGVTVADASPDVIRTYSGESISGITADGDGKVWIGVTAGDFLHSTAASLDRYDPETGLFARVATVELSGARISGPAYDPNADELVFWVRMVDDDTGECAAVEGVFYRLPVSEF